MQCRKILAFLLIATSLFSLGLLTFSNQSAVASEPTPTLPSPNTPTDMLCHLANNKTCSFINPLDRAALQTSMRLHPPIGALDVPTYTQISLIFTQDIAPNTLTNSFFLSQGDLRIDSATQYISAGKMAILTPHHPLEPNTVYTATLTDNIKDLSGLPLASTKIWTFTTTSGALSLSQNKTSQAAMGGLNIYFGDLHGHTSYSDGQARPANAFSMAKASGLHFFGLTEHAFMMDNTEWQDILAQANTFTINGQFVALSGFEFSSLQGHVNVFGSDTYIHRNDPNYNSLDKFFSWLANQPTAIAEFNHPGDANLTFNNFAYQAEIDHKIVLQELTTAPQFFAALNAGWHLGTLKNRDTHVANWGCCPLMGVLAPELTQDAILAALAAKRTFFVSPNDSNLALTLQANGYWMGSAIPATANINFTIQAYDPNPSGKPLRIFLYDNGVRVAGTTIPSTQLYSWTPTIAAKLGHYYYVEAYHDGWYYPAYSSPVWVEQSPIAQAGHSQIVAPGTQVTLNGQQSQDPDGNALLYQWQQIGGDGVALNQASTAQPTFIAPNGTGDLTFQLVVKDTGSLSDMDNILVTVTNKPILSITKSGPAQVEPDAPIPYILTVTNNGATTASNVIITDALPYGAVYVNGGTLNPDNTVSWGIDNLAAYGGLAQVTFTVTAKNGIINDNYGASCIGCIMATGTDAVVTNGKTFFLPIILKNH